MALQIPFLLTTSFSLYVLCVSLFLFMLFTFSTLLCYLHSHSNTLGDIGVGHVRTYTTSILAVLMVEL